MLAEIIDVKLHFNFEAEKEESYWEQRARVNWLKSGDKNTSFFHKFTSQRHRFNKIRGLRNVDCQIVTEATDMERVARNYFTNLFSSKGIGDTNHLLSRVNQCVTIEMNNALSIDF